MSGRLEFVRHSVAPILAWLSAANRELDGRRPADLLPFACVAVQAAARTECRAAAAGAESARLPPDDL
jgi:hypothetical protein